MRMLLTVSRVAVWRMPRGRSIRGSFIAVALSGVLGCGSGDPGGRSSGFDVWEKSIPELVAALESGVVTSQDLVTQYLDRIEAYDQHGPALNALLTINPDAMAIAASLDAERAANAVRGPLHGIPVIVKDNYDTADMPTTAGTVALATSIPPDDAFQIRKLRDAGAIILAKANMHELAYGMTTISSFGGQTRNPYDPTRNPGGSSGGTGAAVAATFAAVGMGTDTCGSIRIPSAHHSLVGLRGTRGLSSRDGIVPLSGTQDMGGPLARSVEDLAITLDATVGFDPNDAVTRLGNRRIPPTYTTSLDRQALGEARLGIATEVMGTLAAERPVRDVIETAVETMEQLGAAVVEIEDLGIAELLQGGGVIGQDFRADLDAYLAQTPSAAVRSLSEMVERGLFHSSIEGYLRAGLAAESRDTDRYRERLARRDEVRAAIVDVMDEHDLDVLVYPTIQRTAMRIGEDQLGNQCGLSAVSGLPAISVPAGFAADDMPVSVELLGRAFAEPRLLALAYAYEQATRHRRPPDFTPSLFTPPEPITLDTTVDGVEPLSGRATLVLDPSTRMLNYSLSVAGLRDRDVLAIDLHRRGEEGEPGPVVMRLSGRGRGRVAGRVTLEGRELRLLREGRLYVDVHTIDRVAGAVRFDLTLPSED